MAQTQPTVSKLPSVTPLAAPIRGQMITNGSSGTYFIGDHLGSGSYGDVYECTDEWANPLVAKVLKSVASMDDVRKQWEREVMSLMRLRHPNVTYIHDAFVCDNAFFIIVEKCAYSLDRVLPRVDETWVPHIARDILQALAFIHRFGYVHKDVHPGNVFVSLTSDVISTEPGPFLSFKLGDLGITRLEGDIRTGTVLAPWMKPPEAIEPARYGPIGKSTDVYHTALLLLAVLRRSIFQFTESDIVGGEPQRLARANRSPFARPLVQALSLNVADRPQTPLEFWRAIHAVLQRKLTLLHPVVHRAAQ